MKKIISKETYSSHSISNFKSFRETQGIEIAPITLIYGQNSGGKSTLIQSILSLSQSCERIKSGEISFSGKLVEAGTFETIQSRPSKKNSKIIFETSSNSKVEITGDNYYIDAFDPVRESKIRYYIAGKEDPSKGAIKKFEILFDGYLTGHKLIFNLQDIHLPRLVASSNFPRLYVLDESSYSQIVEINKKIIKRVSESFKEICLKAEDKLNITQVLELGIMAKTKFDIGKGHSKEENILYKQLINILQFAALELGGYVDVEENNCIFYKLLDKNKNKNKKYLKILKEFSKKLLEKYFEQIPKGGLSIACEFVKKEELEILDKKNITESKTMEINDFEIIFKLEARNISYHFSSFKNELIGKIIEIQYKNKAKKFADGRREYFKSMHKISILAEEADNLQEKFDLAELDLNLNLDGSKKDKALIEKVINSKKLKEMINTLRKTMFELDSILNDLKLSTNYKYKRQIESASRIILSTPRILESLKSEILKVNIEKNKESRFEYDFFIKFLNISRHYHLFANCLITIQNEYFALINFLYIKSFFSNLKNNEPSEEYFIKDALLFLLGLDEDDYLEFLDFGNIPKFAKINSELYEPEIKLGLTKEIIGRFGGYIRRDSILENLYRGNLLKKNLSFLPIPIYKKFALPQEFTQNVIHLGPARPGAKRFYTTQDIENLEPNDVGYILKTEEFDKRILANLKRLSKSINFLDDIKTSPFKDKSLDAKKIEIKTCGSKAFVNIADTGYGLSQLLPIVLNAVSMKEETIIIQQPETHLHPRLQAEVGSLMVNSVKSNIKKRWIIETHSEIILLRILKLIRSGDFNPNLLRVYYIDKKSLEGSEIQQMSISSKGELQTHWPKGFFSNDLDEIFD